MNSADYLAELNTQLGYLYAFSRQINELDFAVSLGGEFRGAQDAGWATTITADEVYEELVARSGSIFQSVAELRIALMLYCQLAESGGAYETLKNLFGIISLDEYVMWPFKELVHVRGTPRRVIGPNANATFRSLATSASRVGLIGLSSLLEQTFRDDVRNAVSHADYIIWNDGLRLRNRNGGSPTKLPFDEVGNSIEIGVGFFQLFREYNALSAQSFDPPKTIVGRFSANPPMSWTVSFDSSSGFSISGSSPGPIKDPGHEHQVEMNNRLGGRVLSVFTNEPEEATAPLNDELDALGFAPNWTYLEAGSYDGLLGTIEEMQLWDGRHETIASGRRTVIGTPWGFWQLSDHSASIKERLPAPLVELCPPDGNA